MQQKRLRGKGRKESTQGEKKNCGRRVVSCSSYRLVVINGPVLRYPCHRVPRRVPRVSGRRPRGRGQALGRTRRRGAAGTHEEARRRRRGAARVLLLRGRRGRRCYCRRRRRSGAAAAAARRPWAPQLGELIAEEGDQFGGRGWRRKGRKRWWEERKRSLRPPPPPSPSRSFFSRSPLRSSSSLV